jgi:hypothetical protein
MSKLLSIIIGQNRSTLHAWITISWLRTFNLTYPPKLQSIPTPPDVTKSYTDYREEEALTISLQFAVYIIYWFHFAALPNGELFDYMRW